MSRNQSDHDQTSNAKQSWVRPELRRLEAGKAELQAGQINADDLASFS